MDIRRYLINAAEELTEKAPALPEVELREAWQKKRRAQFWHMLGIDRYMQLSPRPPLNIRVTRSHQRDGYRVDCLSYESLPGLYVAANLYVPSGPGPYPALLYVCGHSELQKASQYQQHARAYAELGFVVLIVDTVQMGEVQGFHHGTHRFGWFHWISKGYTPAGVETWNGIRGLDVLSTVPEVDVDRLGVTGTSGGGAMSWWIAAADERIKAVSPSCGTATIASHIRERTIDGHCDCMFPANLYGWSLVDMSALVAPRPLLIVSASRDGLFTIDSINDFYERISRVYEHFVVPQNLRLFTFTGPHSYSESSRRTTFQWFLKQLKNTSVAYDDVSDVDVHLESPDVLNVYTNGLPENDRSLDVHDWFIPIARTRVFSGEEDLLLERARIVKRLSDTTFNAFPKPAPEPKPQVTQRWMLGESTEGFSFSFLSDGGWRLSGMLHSTKGTKRDVPTLVRLLQPEESGWFVDQTHIEGKPPSWRAAIIATKGTGDTVWSPSLQWHLRRSSALIGRTIASMRVFDTLQGIRALRTFKEVNEEKLYLTAKGEMAVVALYAALLDSNIQGVILHDPPVTHDTPGRPDGTGSCLEMLGALQITDLPEVAALLWPRTIVFVGDVPPEYDHTVAQYKTLGGSEQRIDSASGYTIIGADPDELSTHWT